MAVLAHALPTPDFIRTVHPTTGRDDANRLIEAYLDTDADSTGDLVQVAYDYDEAGHLVGQGGMGFLYQNTTGATYTYDTTHNPLGQASGLKTAETLNLQTVESIGGMAATYTYDPNSENRLKTAEIDLVIDEVANGTIEEYFFDQEGNLLKVDIDDQTTVYDYIYEQHVGDQQDPDHDRYAPDSNQLVRIEKDGVTQDYFSFDQDSRWRTSQAPVDAQGDPIANERTDFTYTEAGRLATYKQYDGGSVSTEATYTYDTTGQRTRSVVTEGTTETTIDFTYAGLVLHNLSAVEKTSGTESASWDITYLYDELGKPYAGIYRDDEISSPVVFAITTTDRGDVVGLVDMNGQSFAAYRYDAWGNPMGEGTGGTQGPVGVWWREQQSTGISTALAKKIAERQVLRYAGYCYDSESGMYYLSARHYDPATRLLLSKDPSRNDGEQSAYQYCLGNPVGLVDPTGFSPGKPTQAEMDEFWYMYSAEERGATPEGHLARLKASAGASPEYHPEYYADGSDAQKGSSCWLYAALNIWTMQPMPDDYEYWHLYMSPAAVGPGWIGDYATFGSARHTSLDTLLPALNADLSALGLGEATVCSAYDEVPEGYRKVAVVFAPNDTDSSSPFHFYLMNKGGTFSCQEYAGGPVTDKDASSNAILDPRLADTDYSKGGREGLNYTHFGGYLMVPSPNSGPPTQHDFEPPNLDRSL